MKIIRLTSVGFLLQTFALLAFILVSRNSGGNFLKFLCIGFAALAMGGLLLQASKVLLLEKLIALSLLLAFGYIAGFHLLGALFFPSLLRDLTVDSTDYLRAVLSVAGFLFLLYVFTGISLLLARRYFSRRT